MAQPPYTYEIEIDGEPYEVESADELTDQQAYAAVRAEHEKSPKTLAKKNEQLKAANAKPLAGETADRGTAFLQGAADNPIAWLAKMWFEAGPKGVVKAVSRMGREGISAQGVSDVVRSAGVTAAPAAVPAALMFAPAATVGGAVVGGAAALGAGEVAEAAGATPGQRALTEDIAGMAGGGVGAKLARPVMAFARKPVVAGLRMVGRAAENPRRVGQAMQRAADYLEDPTGAIAQSAELGVSPSSTGALMSREPMRPAPQRPATSMPSSTPRQMRDYDLAATRDEMGLSARPTSPVVQGEGDQGALLQEIARRDTANIQELPVWRQQELMEMPSTGRARGQEPALTPARIEEASQREIAKDPALQRLVDAEPTALKPVSPADPLEGLDEAEVLRRLVNLNKTQQEALLARSPRARALLDVGEVPRLSQRQVDKTGQPRFPNARAAEPGAREAANSAAQTEATTQSAMAERRVRAGSAPGGIERRAAPAAAGRPSPFEARALELAKESGDVIAANEIRALIGHRGAGAPGVKEREMLLREILRRIQR